MRRSGHAARSTPATPIIFPSPMNCEGPCARARPDLTATVKCAGIPRLSAMPERAEVLFVVLFGFGFSAELQVHLGDIAMGLLALGIQLQRLLQVAQGLFIAAHREIEKAQIVEQDRVVRLESHGLLRFLQGLIQLPGPEKVAGLAVEVVGPGRASGRGDRRAGPSQLRELRGFGLHALLQLEQFGLLGRNFLLQMSPIPRSA